MNIILFLFIYLCQIGFTFPHFQKTCERHTFKSFFLQFFHHLFDVYLFFSFFFLNQRYEFAFHAFLVFIIIVHWLTQNNRCILTVLMNRECGYPESDWLDSIKNSLGLRSYSEYFQFQWLGLLILYDIYKLMN